jgi:hypothetical protein
LTPTNTIIKTLMVGDMRGHVVGFYTLAHVARFGSVVAPGYGAPFIYLSVMCKQ